MAYILFFLLFPSSTSPYHCSLLNSYDYQHCGAARGNLCTYMLEPTLMLLLLVSLSHIIFVYKPSELYLLFLMLVLLEPSPSLATPSVIPWNSISLRST